MSRQETLDRLTMAGTLARPPVPVLEPTRSTAEFARVNHETHYQLTEETIVHAIQSKQQDSLIKATKTMDRFNGTVFTATGRVDPEEETLNAETIIGQDPKILQHHCIAMRRGKYQCVLRNTLYGNCPNCYTALPLGIWCHCADPSPSKKLYLYEDAIQWPSIDPVTGERMEPSGYMTQAPPHLLATLTKRPFKIYKDNRYFLFDHTQPQPGEYNPDAPGFHMVPLRNVVLRIIAVDNDIVREDHFEQHMQYLCSLPMQYVERCMNQMHRTGDITQAFYDAITSARAEQQRWQVWQTEESETESETEQPIDRRAHDRDDEDRDDLFY